MIIPMVEDMAIIKYLDVLEYVKGSRETKNSDELAEYQGRKIEAAIETAVQHIHSDHNELATRGDLLGLKRDLSDVDNSLKADILATENRLQANILATENRLQANILVTENKLKDKINNLRYDTLKFVVWTGVGVVVCVAGMLGKGFHWF